MQEMPDAQTVTTTKEALGPMPDRIYIPRGPANLMAVSPELQHNEGAWYVLESPSATDPIGIVKSLRAEWLELANKQPGWNQHVRAAEAILAALASRVSAPIAPVVDWQPAETAPKETEILMAWEDGHLQIVYLEDKPSFWYENAPTHWAPLPAGPSASATASTVAPQQSDWLLDCPICNAPKSFAIDSSDDAVGFCLVERRNWRIIDTMCSTDGCFQPKATFGDLCMECLAKAVDAE